MSQIDFEEDLEPTTEDLLPAVLTDDWKLTDIFSYLFYAAILPGALFSMQQDIFFSWIQLHALQILLWFSQ